MKNIDLVQEKEQSDFKLTSGSSAGEAWNLFPFAVLVYFTLPL